MIQLTDERAINCAKAALKWIKVHKVNWLHTEKKIYSRTYKYAGTMDGLATYSSCQDKACCAEDFVDQLVIVDWKTSGALRLEYILQVSAYQAAYREEHGSSIEHGVILRLGKEDGEFESLQINAEDFLDGFSGYLACLELLKDTEKIEEKWKTKKEYKKAAKKAAAETAKELAKAIEKDAKARAKAEARIAKEEEKKRIKLEAKAAREAAKLVQKSKPKIHTDEEPTNESSNRVVELPTTTSAVAMEIGPFGPIPPVDPELAGLLARAKEQAEEEPSIDIPMD